MFGYGEYRKERTVETKTRHHYNDRKQPHNTITRNQKKKKKKKKKKGTISSWEFVWIQFL
jgi:hypothetical protein